MYYPAGGYLGLYFELFGTPVTPPTDKFNNFVDTISRRRVGASMALVLVEPYGAGIHIGIRDLVLAPTAMARGEGVRRSLGASYADLRPYQWTPSSLNQRGQSPSGRAKTDDQAEELGLLEHYLLTLKGTD